MRGHPNPFTPPRSHHSHRRGCRTIVCLIANIVENGHQYEEQNGAKCHYATALNANAWAMRLQMS